MEDIGLVEEPTSGLIDPKFTPPGKESGPVYDPRKYTTDFEEPFIVPISEIRDHWEEIYLVNRHLQSLSGADPRLARWKLIEEVGKLSPQEWEMAHPGQTSVTLPGKSAK